MGELVDERDLRLSREHGVDVHLLERAVAVAQLPSRDDLEVSDLVRCLASSVRLDEADDDVLAVVAAASAFVQHRERLADACRGPEVDAERASRHAYSVTLRGLGVEREVELEDVHARLAEETERAVVGVIVDEVEHVLERKATGLGDSRSLQPGVLGRDVGVETRAGRRDGVDRHVGVRTDPFSSR